MLPARPDTSEQVLPALPAATELAVLIARMDGVAERLLERHVADRYGRHCLGCALPQTGSTPWPCTLHEVALAAQAIAAMTHIPRP